MREGNVVFFSDMILLIISRLFFVYGSVFVSLSLWWIGYYHLVFGFG